MSEQPSKDQCRSTLSQIFHFLFVGSQEDASSPTTIQKHQITHVINVSTTGDRPSFVSDDDHEHFLRISINDSLDAQLLPYFDRAYAFIEKARLNNGHVLIHCLAGISRSPALAIAYVIRYLHLSADDAYKYVKQRRSQISPNFNFLGQLYQYECSLTCTSTNNSLPKCVKTESPVTERRYCIQVENSCQAENSMRNQTSLVKRPTGFNFNSINTRRSQTTLAPLTSFVQLTLESTPQQSLESSHSNGISIKHLTSKEDVSTVQLINSSYEELKRKKPVDVLRPKSYMEQSNLINSYFQDSRMHSGSLDQCKSLQSFDTNTETLTNGVLSSSLEVFVL
ncbi:unnamed protein product [Adineta ricciae]|uniref:protein-tyrosine-phosphatase n=1 Tax=Adineta ricciae TaxID=249248 RepID=A0A813N3Z9_ADIRI|nr:unnamed protein product [Adineta ricciae]